MRDHIARLRREALLDIDSGKHGTAQEARALFAIHAAGSHLPISEVYAGAKPPLIELAQLQRQVRLADDESVKVRRGILEPRLRIEIDRDAARRQAERGRRPKKKSLLHRIREYEITSLADAWSRHQELFDELTKKSAQRRGSSQPGKEDIENAKRMLTEAISRAKAGRKALS